jgi:hypothetical protein
LLFEFDISYYTEETKRKVANKKGDDMIRSYYTLILGLCTYVMSFYSHVYPCVVTLFNNGAGSVLILDHNNIRNKNNPKEPTSLDMIPRGASRRIGKADEHAHFTIYTKHGKAFITTYDVQQNDCAKNGNPKISFDDLKNKTGETNLFTITETSKHHTSMVRQLPSIQKADIYKEEPTTGCSLCQQR